MNFIIINFNCEIFLIDRDFLTREISNYKKHVKTKNKAIKIRDIENTNFSIVKYLLIDFRISSTAIDDNSIIVTFIKHLYIVNNLKIKLLINNDILKSKQIVLNIIKKKTTINNCKNITTKLTIANREFSIKQIMRVVENIKMSARFNTIISYKLRDKIILSIDRDFMFISQRIKRLKLNDDIFSHIVNVNINVVIIQNISNKKVFISKNSRIDIIQNYEKKNCYLTSSKDNCLTINSDNHKSAIKNWLKRVIKINIIALIVNIVAVANYHDLIKPNVVIFKKLIIFIDIIVYKKTSTIQTQIVEITAVYFNF